MRLSINRESLLKALRMLSGVVEKRAAQAVPVLANVLLVANKDEIIFTGADHGLEIVHRVTAGETEEGGSAAVSFRKLNDICRALSGDAIVKLSVEEDKMIIRSGRSRFVLSTIPAEQFPCTGDIEEPEAKISVNGVKLKATIEKTAFAMAEDDVRTFLNGMLVEIKNNVLTVVAADGHRLAVNKLDLLEPISKECRIIVPRKTIMELLRVLEEPQDILIELLHNQIKFITSTAVLTSRLIEGNFPDHNKIVPQGGNKELVGPRILLKEAFSRASALFTERMRGVKLRLTSNCLQILANNPEQDHVEEDVDVSYSGPDLEIGFNVRYLIDFLTAIPSDNVKMTLSDPNNGVLIEGDGFLGIYVVMPMRI